MNYEKAFQTLLDKYTEAGFELIEQKPNVTLRYRNGIFVLTEEDISEYDKYLENKKNYSLHPTNCGIYNMNYREQLIELLQEKSVFRYPIKSVYFGVKDEDELDPVGSDFYSQDNHGSSELYVAIGRASTDFINYFRFTEYYFEKHLHLLMRRSRIYRAKFMEIEKTQISKKQIEMNKYAMPIKEGLYAPLTIKIYNMNALSLDEALKLSDNIINKCLFELAYNTGTVFGIATRWTNTKETKIERFMEERRKFRYPFSSLEFRYSFPLSKTVYNSNLIKYYSLAMSSTNPILRFLAFYQILEYYFVKISDEELFHKLSCVLKDPNFCAKEHYLNKLVKVVNDFNKKTDETEILKLVLRKYVDEEDFIDFIREYEKYIGENILTKPRYRFSDNKFPVRLEKGHALANTAKIIKEVRNALVHSSDRIERQQRHVPYSEKTEIVWELVPVVKYLAEKVIIATSEILD